MDRMLAATVGNDSTPWLTHHVSLAADRRPDWVSGALSVVVIDNLVLGVSLQISGTADIQTVESHLRDKYRGAPKVSSETECVNQPGVAAPAMANVREWLLPGLHVYYEPFAKGFGCAAGRIYVEADSLHRLRKRLLQEHEAQQPKM